MMNLSQENWQTQINNNKNAVIIDVRTAFEYESGFIENAQLMPIQDTLGFINTAKTLNPETHYYIYCRSGARSQMACQILNSVGIKNAYNLSTGILQWNKKLIVPEL